jgi:hypothetical protein
VTPDDLRTIHQIEEATQASQSIPLSIVRGWMSCASIEVQGELSDFLLEHPQRIEPRLSMEEVFSTVLNSYRRFLIENVQDSDYVSNRSIAGLELVRWFKYLWRDSTVPREYLVRLKAMLRDLCIENRVPQDQVVGAVLEHLFESSEIQDFFADWKSDPSLAKAFALAKDWGDDHLGSPTF